MPGFLAGVPGKLNTLLARLSATWAAKVDRLDTDLTTARAARLDAAISTRATPADVAAAVAALGPALLPPMAGGLGVAPQIDIAQALGLTLLNGQLTADACGAVPDAWEDVINVTGAGVLSALVAYNRAPIANTLTVELIVDGQSKMTLTHAGHASDYRMRPVNGVFGKVNWWDGAAVQESYEWKAPDPIIYTASLHLRQKRSSSSSNSCGVFFRHKQVA